jgi:hypothetical protein
VAGIVDLFGNNRVPNPPPGSGGFNRYSAGAKRYGGGRSMPNIGPVANMQGYRERDNEAAARKAAILRRLKGQATGNPMNKNVLNFLGGGGFI